MNFSNINNLEFRKLDKDGLRTLVKWAKTEGWNPGPHDADVFWVTDPDGFYGYFLNGEMIGGGSIVSYNYEFGFMGFFIMKPEYRSMGIGRRLWYQRRDTLLARLNIDAPIGMDGVVAMQPFYEKGGFKTAFRDERYGKKGVIFETDKNISPVTENDLNELLEYDKKCFGYSRPQFMNPWLKLPGTFSFKYKSKGEFRGFAVMRKADLGYKICPLFADDFEVAEVLYKTCLNAACDELVYLDIPEINKSAVELVKKFNAEYVFECARMYFGKPPELDINKIFGITTFELG